MSKFIDLTGQRFGRYTVICRDDFVKKIANMQPGTLAYRIDSGWSMDKALNTPVRVVNNEH